MVTVLFWVVVITVTPFIVALIWGGKFGWWTAESNVWALVVAAIGIPFFAMSMWASFTTQ